MMGESWVPPSGYGYHPSAYGFDKGKGKGKGKPGQFPWDWSGNW